MTLEAIRVLLEAMRVITEAVRKIIKAVRLFVEAVRVLVEAVECFDLRQLSKFLSILDFGIIFFVFDSILLSLERLFVLLRSRRVLDLLDSLCFDRI